MNNGFDNFLDSTGKLIETVPDFYDDALSPAAKESGKTLRILPAAINAAFAPLRRWIAHQEYSVNETEKLLELKLKDIDSSKIIEPEPYVAVPALQAISYSMDNDELRELYANLLAKSMNIDTKNDVHPSFVEIIKQLSPFEASLLQKLASTNEYSFGIVKVRLEKSPTDSEGFEWIKHLINPKFGLNLTNQTKYTLALENLERLQLINISYSTYLIDDKEYIDIENCNIVSHCKNAGPTLREGYSFVRCKRGSLNITNLGKIFIEICIK